MKILSWMKNIIFVDDLGGCLNDIFACIWIFGFIEKGVKERILKSTRGGLVNIKGTKPKL